MHRQHGRGVSLTEQISMATTVLQLQDRAILQLSDEARSGEASQVLEQLVLEPPVSDGGMRLGPALVIPVAAGGAGHISGGERAAGEWLCRLRRTPLVGQHQHHSGAAVGQCWWTWTSQSSGAVRQFP
jgi:hypothetical protein